MDRFSAALDGLILEGNLLVASLTWRADPAQKEAALELAKPCGFDSLVVFSTAYQPWYTEARAVIKQLLPDHLDEFDEYFEIPRVALRSTGRLAA